MSRVPIHFDPWPTDREAKHFRVMSEEWSSDPTRPAQLATVEILEGNTTCKFSSGELWLETGYFPTREMNFTLQELERLCTEPDSYSPRSIYTHRTVQAMRSILRIRCE